MTDMETNFTLTHNTFQAYNKENAYAQIMFGDSGNDYIAARCLILNTLFMQGCIFYAQAVEKMFKALIFLETKRKSNLHNNNLHNPFLLKEELKSAKDYQIDKYDELLKRVYGHWQHRYFDNKYKSQSMSSSELDEYDILWMHLFEQAPFPVEVKYRLQFTPFLFDEEVLKYQPAYRHWATFENKSLLPKLGEMEKIHIAVKKYCFENIWHQPA